MAAAGVILYSHIHVLQFTIPATVSGFYRWRQTGLENLRGRETREWLPGQPLFPPLRNNTPRVRALEHGIQLRRVEGQPLFDETIQIEITCWSPRCFAPVPLLPASLLVRSEESEPTAAEVSEDSPAAELLAVLLTSSCLVGLEG